MSIAYGGDKITFSDGSTVGSGWTGFKNRIINGDMGISQRNGTSSVTITSDGQYSLDRWLSRNSSTSKVSIQQNAGSVTPPAGFTNYLGVTSLSSYSTPSGELYALVQRIEGFNIADLGWGTANAQSVTVSFWVRSSLTGTFTGSLGNSASTRSYVFTYTISAANTWEYKTVTIPGETSGTWVLNNGSGLGLSFDLGSGSNWNTTAGAWQTSEFFRVSGSQSVVGTNGATFYITGVQLEKGSTATSFDYRPYGTELALCQRYYQRIGVFTMQSTTSTTTSVFYHFVLPVTPRATPTMTFGSSTWNRMTNFDVLDYSGVYTPAFNDYGSPNLLSFVVRVTSGATWPANAPLAINPTPSSSAVVIASMEL
jgi:hypothetical protein